MGALQFVDTPGYNAILFRRTYADLTLPEALMDRAFEWLGGKAHWSGKDHTWIFPSGARLSFGYLEHSNDKFRYQSAAFQYIGFDELTQFKELDYRYLFSRLRRLEGVNLPLRMRSASNPGGIGHEWVKQRFITEGSKYGRQVIPAKLGDNPYLDRDEYVKSLMELDPVTRRQLLDGDWTARQLGGYFRREWFNIVEEYPRNCHFTRYWDLAATKPRKGAEPDWTCGLLLGEKGGQYWVVDVQRTRTTPQQVELLVKNTAIADETMLGKTIRIWMEQEPGSSGVNTISHYQRNVLKGYAFKGNKTTGSKEDRAAPFSSACEAGNVFLVRGHWLGAYLDELEAFPQGSHDDQVDASSGAFAQLHGGAKDAWRFG
jgi:predicted phage terminase large subunit-like protein